MQSAKYLLAFLCVLSTSADPWEYEEDITFDELPTDHRNLAYGSNAPPPTPAPTTTLPTPAPTPAPDFTYQVSTDLEIYGVNPPLTSTKEASVTLAFHTYLLTHVIKGQSHELEVTGTHYDLDTTSKCLQMSLLFKTTTNTTANEVQQFLLQANQTDVPLQSTGYTIKKGSVKNVHKSLISSDSSDVARIVGFVLLGIAGVIAGFILYRKSRNDNEAAKPPNKVIKTGLSTDESHHLTSTSAELHMC